MSRARLLRLAILAAVLVALVVVRFDTRFGASLCTARIRELVQPAGAAGLALFVLAFCAGELLHVPGLVFIGAAVLAWGRLRGGLVAYAGAVAAVSASFAVVRAVGGRPLGELRRPRLRALVARLERRPILTVALLRLLFWFAPMVNYALALSPLRYRDFLAGSALGLIPPVALATLLLEYFLR